MRGLLVQFQERFFMEHPSTDQKMKAENQVTIRKGGLRTMPFIIANEAFEKVASYGLQANMILYLITQYNLDNASGASILFIWSAASNFTPLLGAFLSDSYLGRFWVIALGTITTLIGINLLWLTTILKEARPPQCDLRKGNCISPTGSQYAMLFAAFALMALGAGGTRPCSMAFGADQIDNPRNPNNSMVLQSFFNLYYASVGLSIMISISLIVYIMDKFGWVVGFGVPSGVIFLSTVLFLVGASLYVKVQPNKSLFTGFAQVVVVAFKNKHLDFPAENSNGGGYHHANNAKLTIPTEKLRFLNKACIIRNAENDINKDGEAVQPWSLCSVQKVEELKALIRVLPIWSTSIIISVTISQHAFPVIQATTMNRTFISPNFKIPPGSFGVFTLLALTIWIAIYDRILVPIISNITKHKRGITLKQRMGIGLMLSCIAMVVSGLVEKRRRETAIKEGLINNWLAVVHMSAMWLVPQHCLTGIAEAFYAIGQIEFFYSQFPKSMSSIAVAMFTLGIGVGNLAGSLIVQVVNSESKRGGKNSWVAKNINKGHYDYYYWVIAGLCFLNFIYFVFVSRLYGSEEETIWDEDEIVKDEDVSICRGSPVMFIA